MSKLTVKTLEALTSADAGTTIRDEANLSGRVYHRQDRITVTFTYRYRWGDKSKEIGCGTWPKKSLADIRKARAQARALIDEGKDPTLQKKADKLDALQAARAQEIAQAAKAAEAMTVRDLAAAWLKDGVARKDGNAELHRRFAKDLYPKLGDSLVSALTEHHIRDVLRGMLARGVVRQTISFFADLTQMFGWARKRQPWRALLIDGDPTELVEIAKLVPTDYVEERDRVLSGSELLELKTIFEQMTADYDALPAGKKYSGVRPLKKESQLALWVCLGTLCRIGELLLAEWKHVDLDALTWFIPRENVKGMRGKKQDHHVFLSPFSAHAFVELKKLTGSSRWCFPAKNNDGPVNSKVISKQVGDRQARFKARRPLANRRHDDTLVLAQGANGEWSPHDLRRTGATLMQSLGVSLDVIDRCQNHVMAGSRVRRHYLHHDYADEKKEAWNRLSERLQTLTNVTAPPS